MIKEIIKNHQSSIINRKSSKGFTLIELLIVVSIIGVLATLLMVNFVGVRQRARDAQRKSDLRQIQSALEIYRADNSAYPLTISGLASNASTTCPSSPPSFSNSGTIYMQKIPCDPLGTEYFFSSTGTTYSIITCLENINDNQKDSPASVSPCDTTGTNNWSYTVQNP